MTQPLSSAASPAILPAILHPSGFEQAETNFHSPTLASDGRLYYTLSTKSIDHCGRVYRYDPARDDMPVSSSRTLFKKDGTMLEETKTQYSDYAQLPGGQWYPTRWVDTLDDKRNITIEHRLQILSKERLDPVWFTDPNVRFGKK